MSNATRPHGFEGVSRFLAARGLQHAVVEHSQTYTAAAEARVAAVPPEHAAKAIMARDAAGYVLALIPASRLLDLSSASWRPGRSYGWRPSGSWPRTSRRSRSARCRRSASC